MIECTNTHSRVRKRKFKWFTSHIGSSPGKPTHTQGEKGATILEFSICISLLITLLFGVAALSVMLRERADISQIARLAARAGANTSLGGTEVTRAQTVAETAFQANGIDPTRYNVTVSSPTIRGKQAVSVTITPRDDSNTNMLVGYILRPSRSSATFILS